MEKRSPICHSWSIARLTVFRRLNPPVPLRLFGICGLLFLLFLSGGAQGAAAPESVYLPNLDGSTVFRLDFFGQGLPYAVETDGAGLLEVYVSANDFSLPVREDIVRGAAYWANILKPRGAPADTVVLRLGVVPDTSYNAAAFYFANPDDSAKGSIWSAIMDNGSPLTPSGLPCDPLIGAHSLIIIHDYAWDSQANSNLPETPATMAPTMIHEIGHALGINEADPEFAQWLQGDPGELFFTGPTAVQVFGGGVPMAHISDHEGSHFGVRNGLMTHVQITNYPMFMEVELASLVDIGYAIDLRNFFGASLYDDTATPKTVNNTKGFFVSQGFDSAGNWLGYAEGSPNTSLFGVGLHIYGRDYGITQRADLLADGAGGAGVRVDGFNNRVTIPEEVRVTGNGTQGTGLLVSFGSGHRIISQGVISAVGPLGIGARFDFGAPYVTEALYSYGTYYVNPEAVVDVSGDRSPSESVTADIGGPLVESFDLSGALLGGPSASGGQYLSGEFVDYGGRPVALYIGPGAHVKTVNIMNGAFIYGDLISRWDPAKYPGLTDPQNYLTDLTFGRSMGSDGTAIPSSGDPAFALRYRGDILSPSSINVSLVGGSLDYAGSMQVRSFSMAADSRLLTEFVGGRPTTIAAGESVNLAQGSGIGFAPSAFSYGRQLTVGGNPVLAFTESLPGNVPLLQPPSSGSFAVGAFDYVWDSLYWDAKRNAVMINTTEAAFNHQRGGTDALNAPLAIIRRQPGLDAVSARMVRRFSAVAAQSPVSCFENARRASSPVQRLSPGDGGWEAAADRNGLWAAPAYGFLKHSGGRDYTIRGAGVTVGLDRYVADNLYLGLALSLDYPRYESNDADVDAWGVAGIFYGGLALPRDLELGFIGSLGGLRFDQTRAVSRNRYHSSYDAKIVSVGASFGRRFEVLENFMLRPFADWHYFYSSRGSYSERADVYGLRYEDSRNKLHRLQTGLEGVWAVENGGIGAKVYWSGLRGDTKKASAASFVLDPDANRFNAPVDGLDENSLGLGLNAGIRLGANTELRLGYSMLHGKTATAHEGMIGLRYNF
ncbi:MAG: autotransporter outer membrane beta-barrel domain-containing protein [Candidatus Adiutrix sp.]|jgi:hypothetical protein|nr:autotransporter outer membrane beta-barrel domain-containing protein [Candidatus Adiutrix sp.]